VLELVGLAHTGRKRAGQFSLGMKQRLGLAIALLPSPELLILDEPTNGLDPNGIAEMRALLLRLNREFGTTILISSHLLAEIDRLVTHVGILHRGRLLFQGTMEELRRRQQQVLGVVLRTGDDARALDLVRAGGLNVRAEPDRLLVEPLADEEIAALARRLIAACVDVHEIGVLRNDLETIFMDLVEAQA
jgi:lantibiotic transport system ATP-binding protein